VIQEPIQPTPSPTPAAGSAWHRAAPRAGLSVAALILLALAVVMAMAANAPSVSPTKFLAAGASAAPSPGRAGTPEGGKGGAGRHRFDGSRGGGAPVRGPITIRAISGDQLSLATDDGWTRTITLSATTAITKGGATIGVAALKVGDEIGFKETRNADGSYAISAVHVVLPSAGGVVTKVDGNDITVKGRAGTVSVIHVSGATTYKTWGRGTAALGDVTVGDVVIAEGTRRSDGSLDASRLFVGPDRQAKPPKAPKPATSAVPG
jgi:hypothetical protein